MCRERPEPEAAFSLLDTISSAPSYPQLVSYLAHGFVAIFFTLFWGGTALDACLAFLCGAAVKASVAYLSRFETNIFFTYVCSSMAMVLPPLILSYICLLYTSSPTSRWLRSWRSSSPTASPAPRRPVIDRGALP